MGKFHWLIEARKQDVRILEDRIKGIEQEGWEFAVNYGHGMVDTTAIDLREAKEQLAAAERQIARLETED